MPRRRRIDKRKSIRKLDSRIWEALQDCERFSSVKAPNGFTFFACLAIEQGVPRGNEVAFWDSVRDAVLAGEFDVDENVQHTSEDTRLLVRP